jgi:hypothetical protein
MRRVNVTIDQIDGTFPAANGHLNGLCGHISWCDAMSSTATAFSHPASLYLLRDEDV